MKFLTALVLASFLVGQVHAVQLTEGAVGIFATPFITSRVMIDCAAGADLGADGQVYCLMAYTAAAGSTITTVAVLLKEEVKQVQPDAYQFLAGEPMTLALAEALQKVRAQSEETKRLSNEELASLFLTQQL